ncbi:IclR family transcriptional regulator [Lichenifustis flavocetrariae]|uniref:IclR family transcriptional regulator n=1 Tax=Lichenifustis flavocetrariae TaxID=2949735 RepID=A0AA41YZE8_9HYPH|nr:IclR family transcriptional regulator [Lichenifustis flavocetrariae]MCW6510944.1 IclR family transcriptional regulator [Lichenifustis flavocetrariae]
MTLTQSSDAEALAGAMLPRTGERQRGIDRAIGVLELLLQRRQPLSAGEIARALKAPRSTIYEIVNRLIEAGMLEPAGAEGQVFFGRTMHLFGSAYLNSDSGLRRFGEALDSLSAATGATVQCCTRRNNKYVVLDCRDGTGAFRITSEVGAEVPLPWTASGRALLGHLSDEAILTLIPPADFRLPNGGLLSPNQFLSDVAQARQNGFFEATGLASSYTWCQAVPVFGRNGIAAFTLCFVLPIDSAVEQRERCLALLIEKARQLSHATAG